ncbi:hypothetical protein KXW53_005819 [Aspergillus fumigatus]|nr:hypothetical protein KXW53_005819 [Aspergillus fumigatus]KAH2954215.1 hypothetical protein KXW43_006172 [Aspergillus fumigatus]
MPKKGCKRKVKNNSNNLRRTVTPAAPPYLQAAVVEMAESWAPVPDPDPESISEAMPAPLFEPAPELGVQAAPQCDPEPVSDLALEEMDKAAEEYTVKKHEIADAPATGANEATKPVSERAEIATEAPAILPEPVVVEYAQPNTSPYEGKAVTVLIGSSEKCYTIPENLLSKATTLPCCQDVNGSPVVILSEVDEDIGHTIMHYLYTGKYETVKPPSTSELPRRATEYIRSVFAYRVAVRHGLDGLAEHAKRYIQIFDKEVSIIDIISLGRKAFPKISEEPWFSEYLTARITASFEADEGIFQREQFFEGFGETLDFDKFLGKVMAQVYSNKISSIRYEAGLRSGDNTIRMPNADKGEIVTSDRDVSITQASSTEGALCPRSESGINEESSPRADALNGHTPSTGRISDTDFDHRRPEYIDESDMSTNAEYDEVGSSEVNILTPDSGTDNPVPTRKPPSYRSEDNCFCPHWRVHSTDRDLWKGCELCKGYLRRMFTDLVNDGW